MFTVKENTTLVGISEFRAGLEAILEKTRKGLVIIEKRHKPQAVLMSSEEYEQIQQTLETAEDLVLGFLAKERDKNSKAGDYIDIEKLI